MYITEEMMLMVSLVLEEKTGYTEELLDLRNDFVFKSFFSSQASNHLSLFSRRLPPQ